MKNPMETKPVFPLLMSMAIPPMISMLIQSMYNIVDSIFVARLGENALTAVSLAYPLQNLVLAVAVGLGIGANAGIARNLGAKKQERVNQIASHTIFFTAIHAIIFVLIGIFLTKPFLQMFTKNEMILKWGCEYSYIVICLSFGSLFHIAIEKMFQACGNMLIPMALQALGAIINIILDPILIFGHFGMPAMGVKGAAIATVIGQFTACICSVILLFTKGKEIKICFKEFRVDKEIASQLYIVAIPSTIMMSLPSVLIGVLNGILASVSQVGVAVLGIYFKLQTFVYMPGNGVIQGMRPMVSYSYGAKRYDRLREIIKVSVLVSGVIMILGTILFVALPRPILELFNAGTEMMKMGERALRIIGIGFVFSAVSIVFAGVFEALGRGVESLTVSLFRQLVIIIPASLILVKIIGVNGVWVSFPIAEIAAMVISLFLLRRTMHRLVETETNS